jgi:hypothetical protein
MYERGKSDGPVVPAKPPNNTACAVAEVVVEKGAKGTRPAQRIPDAATGMVRPMD